MLDNEKIFFDLFLNLHMLSGMFVSIFVNC